MNPLLDAVLPLFVSSYNNALLPSKTRPIASFPYSGSRRERAPLHTKILARPQQLLWRAVKVRP